MSNTSSIQRTSILLVIPVLLFGLLILLMNSFWIMKESKMALAITLDLLLVIPFIYFLLIRKTTIPNTTVIPVMILGLVIGSYFLPKHSQSYLELFKMWVLPVIEISVLTLVIIKFRASVKKYSDTQSTRSHDFFTAVKDACVGVIPQKLIIPFATELAVFYYGFINWRTLKTSDNEFTYHKNSGTPALMAAFIFIIGIETIVIHILLARWSGTAAWIFSGVSIYSGIQIFGFARSLSKRPVFIDEHILTLRYGILSEAIIPLKDIDRIEISGKDIDEDNDTGSLSPLGKLESHNVILYLKKCHTITGLYGSKKDFKNIALHIDDKLEFKAFIEEAIA